MRIANLKIENFRGVKRGYVRFGPHSMLVGPNNCGKTTVIEALALLFGRDRMVRTLTEHDFYGSNPQPADRIRLVATIVGFEGDDPADHTEWFRHDRGIPKWWNPANDQISPARDDPTWRLACQIGLCARFDRASLEVETERYFHDDDAVVDVFVDETWAGVSGRLIRDAGFFLVPAGRTWDRVVSFGSELFRRVVAAGDGQPAESVLGERDRLREPEQPLEADQRLQPIVERLNAEIAGFFRSPPKLHLRVTTTDSEGILDAVVPHYGEAETSMSLPARRHGTGLVSLQYLLLLLEFGRLRAASNESFWMALEEPELHVPPPLQRRLVHRIQALSTQTFVSTHSPTVAALCDPQTVAVLRNDRGDLTCTPLLDGALPASTPNAVRKLFQLNRVETISALMHDVVLTPEGRIDYEWLKLLVRTVDLHQGWAASDDCRFGSCVGVIPTHDAAVVAVTAALDSLHPRITALVDGDATGVSYAQTLAAATPSPSVIIRWPNSWAIEDIIGWILHANDSTALAALSPLLTPSPTSVPDLVRRLKSEDRSAHGLKQDQVSYEAVADVIGAVRQCRVRTREFLDAMSSVLLTGANPRFLPVPTGNPRILVFQP